MDIPPPPGPPQLRKNLSLTHFHDLQDHPFAFHPPTHQDGQQLQRQLNNHQAMHQHPHLLHYQQHPHPAHEPRELNYGAPPLQFQLGEHPRLPLSSSASATSSTATTASLQQHQMLHQPPQQILLQNPPQQELPSRFLLSAPSDFGVADPEDHSTSTSPSTRSFTTGGPQPLFSATAPVSHRFQPPPDICNVAQGDQQRLQRQTQELQDMVAQRMKLAMMNSCNSARSAQKTIEGSGYGHGDHFQAGCLPQLHQTPIIGFNGDTMTGPPCFGHTPHPCNGYEGCRLGAGEFCPKFNGGHHDHLVDKCVNLQLHGTQGPQILDCRQVGGGPLCFENCNYSFGQSTGDLLLLENDLVRETGFLAKGGGSGGAVTPTASMGSNGMMPWRHRQCPSSRGSSSSASSATRKFPLLLPLVCFQGNSPSASQVGTFPRSTGWP